MNATLAPYKPVYDVAIRQLENRIAQGKGLRLKIVKDRFLDRAIVFRQYNACLSLNGDGTVIGTAIGAETVMEVNGVRFRTGVGFDVKVDPAYKNKGVGTMMAAEQRRWFAQQGLQRAFTTLKISNAPVVRLVSKAFLKIWLTPFVYLTLPTATKLDIKPSPQAKSRFALRLFDSDELPRPFYTVFPSGLGCFHTWKMYRLHIERMSRLYKISLPLLRRLQPRIYGGFGGEGSELACATLFNHNPQNIGGVADVLQHLEKQGKSFLLVCCQKDDAIYRALKRHSINSYSYYLLSDFPISANDAVAIDVRCL